jgi:hypothetical protein
LDETIYEIPRPIFPKNGTAYCEDQYRRICGGSDPFTQYCIDEEELCPITDLRVQKPDSNSDDFFNLNENFGFKIERDANFPPLTSLLLSERPPCSNPYNIELEPIRPEMIVLEKAISFKTCDNYNSQFRPLANKTIEERKVYDENGISKILNTYV